MGVLCDVQPAQGKAQTCEWQTCLGPCLLVWGSSPVRLTGGRGGAHLTITLTLTLTLALCGLQVDEVEHT